MLEYYYAASCPPRGYTPLGAAYYLLYRIPVTCSCITLGLAYYYTRCKIPGTNCYVRAPLLVVLSSSSPLARITSYFSINMHVFTCLPLEWLSTMCYTSATIGPCDFYYMQCWPCVSVPNQCYYIIITNIIPACLNANASHTH